MTQNFSPALLASTLEEKTFQCVVVDDVPLVISHLKGEFFAVRNQCSHARAPFDLGRLRNHKLFCPLHGAVFDARNGAALELPARRPIDAFATRVNEDGMVEVDVSAPLPATAS
ncbi:MAG: Rieske (2Fe-2S) protein [Lysobacterales bacterium]